MKHILFSLLLGCLVELHAQQAMYPIRVQDAATGMPLNRASIVIEGQPAKYTNDNGVVILRCVLPVSIQVSFVGYEPHTLILNKPSRDTFPVKLKPAKQQLPEVSVSPKLPEAVYVGSQDIQVIDYAFLGSYTFVGVYNYRQRKCRLLILDGASQIMAEEPLPSDFVHFYESCIHKYYAVSGSIIQEIQFRKGLVLLSYVNDDFFYKKVCFYKGFYKEYFYIMAPHKSNLAHLYYVENTLLKRTLPFAVVGSQHEFNKYRKDELAKARKRRSDLKSMGLDDSENAVVGYYEKETRGEFIKGSQMELSYTPVVSKLFVSDSTLLLFDFAEGLMDRFQYDGKPLDSVPFTFHQSAGWQPVLERNGHDYYTSYLNKDSVVTIATIGMANHIRIERQQKLRYPGAFQWKIHNGYVYYLFDTSAFPNNRFLCREKLQ